LAGLKAPAWGAKGRSTASRIISRSNICASAGWISESVTGPRMGAEHWLICCRFLLLWMIARQGLTRTLTWNSPPPFPLSVSSRLKKPKSFIWIFSVSRWIGSTALARDLPLYAQISRSCLTLHLSEHYGDATPGSAVFIPTRDIDCPAAGVNSEQYRYSYARPGVETLDWGKQVNLTDPFGNCLRFCEQTDNA